MRHRQVDQFASRALTCAKSGAERVGLCAIRHSRNEWKACWGESTTEESPCATNTRASHQLLRAAQCLETINHGHADKRQQRPQGKADTEKTINFSAVAIAVEHGA